MWFALRSEPEPTRTYLETHPMEPAQLPIELGPDDQLGQGETHEVLSTLNEKVEALARTDPIMPSIAFPDTST